MQAADVDETGQPVPKAYRNMKKLEPPDTHYLRAAEGWVGLGDLVSAAHELKQISPALQVHPEVLMVRCDILADARKWDAFLVVAEVLFKVAPENPDSWLEYSFALHQVKRTEEAVDLLLPSVRKFPKY